MRAAVVFRSRTGTTRRFAEAIGAYLRTLDVETVVASVGEANPSSLVGADFVLLGCWTSGLMVVRQGPDQPWIDFAREIPQLQGSRVGLFTTYKLLTGSMFGKMRRELAGRTDQVTLELKSRHGDLSDEHRQALARFTAER